MQSHINIQSSISLKKLSSFQTTGYTNHYINISTEDDLLYLIKEKKLKDYPKRYILGKGCNTLFTKDFPGLILHNKIMGKKIIENKSQTNTILMKVGGGEDRVDFVQYCVQNGYAGIENLSEIPGTIGAAPIQNIGAYGVEVGDCIEKVEGINLLSGEKKIFTQKECSFSYRDSIFKQHLKGKFFITAVYFRLHNENSITNNNNYIKNLQYADIQEYITTHYEKDFDQQTLTIQEISNIISIIRKQKLPNLDEWGTAGSFFKNVIIPYSKYKMLKDQFPELKYYPLTIEKKDNKDNKNTQNHEEEKVKIPTAQLLEIAGFKNILENNIGTYKKHALIVISKIGSNGKDIENFTKHIQNKIKKMFSIEIEAEVNIP